MKTSDPILFRELPVIQKIIHDELWLEGERRGCCVPPDDRIVRARVCDIVLRIGQQLREACSTVPSGPLLGLPGNVITMSGPDANEAA